MVGKVGCVYDDIGGRGRTGTTGGTSTRGPEGERWERAGLQAFHVPPWTEATEQMQDAAAPTRRRYLKRAVVDRHGQTANCPACQGQGGSHTPRCRERLEKLLPAEEERLRDERQPRQGPEAAPAGPATTAGEEPGAPSGQ